MPLVDIKPFTRNFFRLAFIFIFSLSEIFAASAQKTDTENVAGFKFKAVVIDAGHGGKDAGANRGDVYEKRIALGIALKLRDAINASIPSVRVVMTRSTDVFVELQKRAQIANDAKANMFISIHCNSSPETSSSRHGALVLVYGFHRKGEQLEAIRENASIYQEKDYKQNYGGYTANDPTYFIMLDAFLKKYRKQSIEFGKLIDDEFTGTDHRRSEGVHEQGLLVLAHSAMPAVLVETGFVNSPADAKYLTSDDGQTEIAQSIMRALKKYKKNFEQN